MQYVVFRGFTPCGSCDSALLHLIACCRCFRGSFLYLSVPPSAIMRDLGVTPAVIISGEARLWVPVFLSLLTASLLCCYSCDTA